MSHPPLSRPGPFPRHPPQTPPGRGCHAPRASPVTVAEHLLRYRPLHRRRAADVAIEQRPTSRIVEAIRISDGPQELGQPQDNLEGARREGRRPGGAPLAPLQVDVDARGEPAGAKIELVHVEALAIKRLRAIFW